MVVAMDRGRGAGPADQLDMDTMAETELARLQRQYRIMEGDRKAFLDDITKKLKRQKQIILRLRKEKDDLSSDIKVTTCHAQKRKDTKISSQLEKLLHKHGHVVGQLEASKRRLEEIEQQIRKSEKSVTRLKLKEVTDGEFRERIKSGERSIGILENKLETVIKRFCNVLTENKMTREEIDHLLKERARFNAIWDKLLFDLNSGKKFMLDLIEQATLAYDQREEWCSKLQALKIRTHNDVIIHTQEMREMQRELDQDGNLREFLTVKGQKRIMRDLEDKEAKKKEQERGDLERQIKMYQETLDKIKEFCNENDIGKIASKYLKQEEENFALFNYVNELNHELEVLNESIEETKSKIEEQQAISEQTAQKQRDTMESLEKALLEATGKAAEDENILAKKEAELRRTLDGINNIFHLIQCEFAPILDLLGKNADINEDNVFIYLGLVEKKVSGLITTIYFKEKSLCNVYTKNA